MATKRRYKSIYELAQRTGVSASTVSRVLNQRGRISLATRRKVLAAARAGHFRPRVAARGINVGVVMDRAGFLTFGGFLASLLACVLEELARQNVTVQVFTEKNVGTLGECFVDGVLAMTWDAATVEQLRRLAGVPVVLLNRMDVPEFSAVATDHQADGRIVAEYLLARGHRRMAFLAEEHDWGAAQRLAGYRQVLAKAGCELGDELVAFSEHQPLYGLLGRLMAQGPTAVFLAGEDIALESAHILASVLGARIPQDISVVGLENRKVSQFLTPPHTTLAQPMDRLAREALRLLLQHVETGSGEPLRVTLDNELIERESVRALTGQDRTESRERRK
jgi:DNA-binding LacI/PurR family transcriptional regulator